MMEHHDQYFAQWEPEDLATHLNDKFTQWRDRLDSTGRESRLAKSYRYYYGQQIGDSYSFDESSVNYAGDDGELAVYSTNHYRNLVRHILAMTTSHKPSYDCRAINTDLNTLSRARLGGEIVQYYMREKKLYSKCKRAGEMSLILAKGFVVMNWDTTKGKPKTAIPVVNPELEGDDENPMMDEEQDRYLRDEDGEIIEKIVYEGDIMASVHSPLDVRVDEGVEEWDEVKWADVRDYQNKWDLVAQYPQHKDDILACDSEGDLDKTKYLSLRNHEGESDFVAIHTFYHLPCPALPSGRLVKRVGDTVLFDGPYPYGDKFNVFRIAPGEVFGSTEGFTVK